MLLLIPFVLPGLVHIQQAKVAGMLREFRGLRRDPNATILDPQ
jgi:hypothetical protein